MPAGSGRYAEIRRAFQLDDIAFRVIKINRPTETLSTIALSVIAVFFRYPIILSEDGT